MGDQKDHSFIKEEHMSEVYPHSKSKSQVLGRNKIRVTEKCIIIHQPSKTLLSLIKSSGKGVK